MKTMVAELEKEKYDLLEKVNSLEIAKGMVESESQRKDDKLKELAIKVTAYSLKLVEYRDKSKVEQKNICALIRRFAETLKQVHTANQTTVDYVTRVFHGLAIQRDYDINDFSLFDVKSALETLCSTENSSVFKKIDFTKMRDSIMKGFLEGPNLKEASRLFESTYKTLLTRMERCQTSTSEIAMLCTNFESHKNLMKENNALLRSSTMMRDSLNLNSSRINLDDSIMYKSSRLDESLILGNDNSLRMLSDINERSNKKHMKRFSIGDDSMIELETNDQLDESPKRKGKVQNFSCFIEDP